jgi:hypothetical protein
MSETEHPVRNTEAESQFQWTADGETAVLKYQLKPGSIAFMHTGVSEKLQRQHIARKLAGRGLGSCTPERVDRDTALPVRCGLPQKASKISGSRQKEYRERVTR